jgi:enoyl-CoA hydratase/carnithine racemase
MSHQQILYAVDEQIATITLNRPEALNAWTDVMAQEVWDAMHAADADEAVRVIILTGAGRAFCAGGDIGGFSSENPRRLIDKLPRAYDFSRRPDYQSRATYFPSLSKPVIAMINGPAAGLGLAHALFADVRIAAEEATITTAFARIGLASEYGAAWALRNLVGHGAACDLLLSGRRIRGPEALRIGLVSQVHPADQLLAATREYAREIATRCSPRSTRVLKQQLWELPFQSLHEAVIADSDAMLAANTCEDFAEGKRAFMEKRPPAFTGR